MLVVVVAIYVGFPLYWKLSATIQEIREKRPTVREGISQLVLEAQRSVGWFYDESDSGLADDGPGQAAAAGTIPSRRRLTGAA
ncbi:unnamed protein product [Spirodela intermedia]|nr:unnamed protein product [Spirodela intermedia]CAA6669049.1 unnamed protein product [Spirodela intermedia]